MDETRSRGISRRTFIKLGAAGVAVAGASAWVYGSREKVELPESTGKVQPLANAPSPTAPLRPKDIEDLGIRRMSELDRLPWFRKDEAGHICLRPDAGIVPIIDTHAHLGWAYGFGHSIDMNRKCPTQYFYDYEKDQDVLFTQAHPTPEEGAIVSREGISSLLRTPERNRTHSVANLCDEMNRLNYRNIVLLPIEIPHQSRHTRDTFDAARLDQRLVAFGAIYPKPWGPPKIAQLEAQVKAGIRAIKYHPVFQLLAPDDPDMMKLFDWCQANNILVYAHIGYTGHEPGFMKKKSRPERFEAPLRAFPKLRVVFAHTGVRLMDETLEVARRHEDQVWLDISGRSASNITYILQRYSTEKIMYASDWPFMPLAIMLARGLVATESCPQLRERFFNQNAAHLLQLT